MYGAGSGERWILVLFSGRRVIGRLLSLWSWEAENESSFSYAYSFCPCFSAPPFERTDVLLQLLLPIPPPLLLLPPLLLTATADIPPPCSPRVSVPTRANRRQKGERTRKLSSQIRPPRRPRRARASLETLTGSAASPSTTARRVRSLCRSCGRGTQHMHGEKFLQY